MRRAFSEEDFPVNFSQRKNDFKIESTPGKKNTSVNLTSYETKTGIKCFLWFWEKKSSCSLCLGVICLISLPARDINININNTKFNILSLFHFKRDVLTTKPCHRLTIVNYWHVVLYINYELEFYEFEGRGFHKIGRIPMFYWNRSTKLIIARQRMLQRLAR